LIGDVTAYAHQNQKGFENLFLNVGCIAVGWLRFSTREVLDRQIRGLDGITAAKI